MSLAFPIPNSSYDHDPGGTLPNLFARVWSNQTSIQNLVRPAVAREDDLTDQKGFAFWPVRVSSRSGKTQR